jgi:hypothetical protein
MKQKQLQKRATNPFVNPNSGGIILRGVDPGFDTTAPTFNLVVAAGGNQLTATLNSGNASLYEFIRVEVTDSSGRTAGGAYSGGAIVIDTTDISKASSSSYPAVNIQIVWQLKEGNSLNDGSRVLSYGVPVDAATMAAGVTINTANRLNTTDRGAQISIAAEYTTGPDQVVVDLVAISCIGLEFDVLENGSSIGTITIGSDGTGTLTNAATLAPGDYTYKAIVTTAGAAYGSFATVTITVV